MCACNKKRKNPAITSASKIQAKVAPAPAPKPAPAPAS